MQFRSSIPAASLAALLTLGTAACNGAEGEGDVGEPDTGIAEEEMGEPGEAGGAVPADTGEDDL